MVDLESRSNAKRRYGILIKIFQNKINECEVRGK